MEMEREERFLAVISQLRWNIVNDENDICCSSHLGRHTQLTLLSYPRTTVSHGLLSPCACNITTALYFPSRETPLQGSDQPLLYYVQVASPSANYFFIVLNSNGFRSYRHGILNECLFQRAGGALHEKCMPFKTYFLNYPF